ncbi:MAG: VOC family protein [Pyrinomonadaceae bacterium]
MAENFIEQLDQAWEVVKANPDAHVRVPADVEPLLSLARELRGLPRAEFKFKLKENLMRRASMESPGTATAAKPVDLKREGFHTITPYLAVREARELIEFVKKAFGGEGTVHGTGSEGGIHAEYKIGDSIVMIGGGGSWKGSAKITALHVYVDDVDDIYQKALAAGATSMNPPIEAHGERVASVQDLAGNEWYIAKRLSGSHTDEGLRNVNVYLHPQGAAQMIEFLKESFGAEEIMSHRATPDGPVLHAKIKIGDSVLEMGEGHGRYVTLPSMLFLYVDDVEAWHRRAVAGGATSIEEPRDQPYGDRVGAVTDPFGNTWYMATPIQKTGG